MGDEFAGAKDVRPNKVAFSKVEDYIIGFFYGSKQVPGEKGPINIYELRGINGAYHFAESSTDVNGNKVVKIDEQPTQVVGGEFYTVFGGKDSIDSLFRKSKLGQKVGIKFEKADPSKKAGYSGFKHFKTVMWDETDPEFMGQSPEDMVGASGI